MEEKDIKVYIRKQMSKLKEKGITLVALVVTIIILLILAGVTIAQIGGNNGLFSRVRQAVDKYKNASIEEQLEILEIDKYVSDFTVSEEEGVLVKITKVEVTAGADTITINVTIEGKASKIEYSKDNEKTWQVKEDNDKSTEYIYEKVDPGSYFIKVRATDENGKTAIATSDVVTVTPETTADVGDVLEEKTFLTGEGIIKTGSMKKHGKIEETVSPGNPYTLEEGYYEGGTITAAGIETQTPGDAGAGDILENKKAWVDGKQLTGTMPNQGNLNRTVPAGGSLPLPAGYYDAGTITTSKASNIYPETSEAVSWNIGWGYRESNASTESSVFEANGYLVYYSIKCTAAHIYDGTGSGNFKLQGSLDKSTWTTIKSVSKSGLGGITQRDSTIQGYMDGYNYYKITASLGVSGGGMTQARATGTIDFYHS